MELLQLFVRPMVVLLSGLVMLAIFLYYYPLQINATRCIDIEQAIRYVDDGDLLLISCHYNSTKRRILTNLVQLVSGQGEWCHVALIVKINHEPYVFDTCPWNKENINYDYEYTLNPRKDSGFVRLRTYINGFNGHIGIRKLKPAINRELFRQTCFTHNLNTEFSLTLAKIFRRLIPGRLPLPLADIKYKFSCSENVASVYEHTGVYHQDFYSGMFLYPFVDDNSNLFEDVVHVTPGKLCKTIAKTRLVPNNITNTITNNTNTNNNTMYQ